MAKDFGNRQRNVEMDNLSKRPASISPCKSGSHDIAEPAERDTTCQTGDKQHESPPESDLPSGSLLGE